MNTDALLALINKYIACSKYMCSCLRDFYNVTGMTLLTASKSYGIIPKEGKLPDGTYFNFHGGGCFFEFENGEIDIDFGPDDRCDGFDLYRLRNFSLYTEKIDINNQECKIEFEKLITDNIIYNPGWAPGFNLYYLR